MIKNNSVSGTTEKIWGTDDVDEIKAFGRICSILMKKLLVETGE